MWSCSNLGSIARNYCYTNSWYLNQSSPSARHIVLKITPRFFVYWYSLLRWSSSHSFHSSLPQNGQPRIATMIIVTVNWLSRQFSYHHFALHILLLSIQKRQAFHLRFVVFQCSQQNFKCLLLCVQWTSVNNIEHLASIYHVRASQSCSWA